ncbi:myocyte-specific enhancer factor 2C-like isoform X1 [Saccostrea echinata]|uniref:myocyte-specific enhancer factor 2C-like isoform X1 n=2 Tax=Saccostrea echinata TaxID=191078 RepID=UPI002A819D03|nr:myocyte-specific enhancer factor 2C-like isoform X1 [Saccostrea echinata]
MRYVQVSDSIGKDRVVYRSGDKIEVATDSAIRGGGKVPGKMGRKKIQISRIGDERNRQVTFTKRKFGLMKKAYELSILCDCEIALIIFNSANKLFQYASTDMDNVLLKYTEYNEPHESRTNKDIIEALNKKEHKGCESPDPDGDLYSNSLTPEEKYNNQHTNRMPEDYQRYPSVQRNMSPYPGPGMPPGLTSGIPLHNYMNQPLSGHGMSPQPPSQVNSGQGLLQPPPVHHSPRPNSTGGMIEMSSPSPAPNGYHHRASPCPSPGAMVNRQSRQSPPSRGPPMGRPMINSHDGMMSPDVQGRPSSSLSNPAVSLTTPSVPGNNYPSPLPTSYHNDYNVNSADLTGHMSNYNHSPWNNGGAHHGGSLTSGIPPGGGGGGQNLHGMSGPGHLSPLAVNTMNQNVLSSIKSEPISPPRESTTPSNHHSLRPLSSTGPGHLSPVQNINHTHSNSSSPTGISPHPLDYDGPHLKRQRVGGWPT